MMTQQPSMKAWRVHEFGGPDKMVLETIPIPSPAAGEVLVKVHAAGVGPWDAWIRAGKSALPQPLPLTLGSDLSGEIVALGSGVADFAVGDQVFGVTNSQFLGAYAEYAVASASMLWKKPASLTHIEAASVPVIAVTAWQALFDYAHLRAGEIVVIHGGAGNVGAFTVQLAHQARLHSIVTASTKDSEYVRSLGAEKVIDYQTQRFKDVIKDADAVLDLVGGDTQTRSFRILRPGGKLISTVSEPNQELAVRHGITAAFFLVNVTTAGLRNIATLIDSGKLKTKIGEILPLSEAQAAHLILDHKRPQRQGKIILSVST